MERLRRTLSRTGVTGTEGALAAAAESEADADSLAHRAEVEQLRALLPELDRLREEATRLSAIGANPLFDEVATALSRLGAAEVSRENARAETDLIQVPPVPAPTERRPLSPPILSCTHPKPSKRIL